MSVAILSDTNSGINKSLADSLGIFLIHMPVIINDQVYYEGDNLSLTEYYSALGEFQKITTSQPSPGDVMDLWDSLLEKGYDEIVYIPMSSGLSNSCAAATAYASDYKGTVQVVDNHRISVTMHESVIQAKELADKGYSAKEIKDYLENDAYNSSIYVTVNTLEYLKKGGRITPAAAMIGSVLSIKPILTIQGEKLDSFQKTRGNMKKAFGKMLDAVSIDISKRFSEMDLSTMHLGIAGANLSQEEIDTYIEIASEHFPNTDIFYDPLSASISCHTGPGALGIGISFR